PPGGPAGQRARARVGARAARVTTGRRTGMPRFGLPPLLRLEKAQHGEHAAVLRAGVRQPELGEDARHVLLRAAQRDRQLVRDSLVRAPLGDELEHLALARSQALQRPVGGDGEQPRHDLRNERRLAARHAPDSTQPRSSPTAGRPPRPLPASITESGYVDRTASYSSASTEAVSITVANSSCRLVAVTRAISSAGTSSPAGSCRSNVCVAS